MSKILFAWLGRSDIGAANKTGQGGLGPIGQAVADLGFERVVLLSDFSGKETEDFCSWLLGRFSVEIDRFSISLTGPTAYAEIYRAVNEVLQECSQRNGRDGWVFHLSPGTPAMAAIWLIFAKTRFPAELIEASVEAGARYVEFPFDLAADFLPDLLRRQDSLLLRLAEATPSAASAFDQIIHGCPAMENLIWRARVVSPRTIPVLIQGESGTGKEMLARAIHNSGSRASGPFIAVNCGAIPSELIDSELFGHAKGAFTGAAQARPGYFEAANGGTLFLDEIGELPLASQVRLLRVLQEKKVTRVGSTTSIDLDVRVISATHRNLMDEVARGSFREDLFHRLAVGVLQIPPLRERAGDIPLLVDFLMGHIKREFGDSIEKKLSVSARKILAAHPWPGNIRELQNALMRAVLWSVEATISAEEMAAAILQPQPSRSSTAAPIVLGAGFDIHQVMKEIAGSYLRHALAQAGGNKTKAAQLLGLASYQTLSNWMRRYDID